MLNKENQDLCWQVLSKYGCEHQNTWKGTECKKVEVAE